MVSKSMYLVIGWCRFQCNGIRVWIVHLDNDNFRICEWYDEMMIMSIPTGKR